MIIRELREKNNMTQAELAEKLNVSDKTVSKWETEKGYPDISLLEPIAKVFGISITELMTGTAISNMNISANMLRSKFYICPICGNVIHSTGEASISCCGVTLMPEEAEAEDDAHMLVLEPVEDETYITINHPMTKDHYISFMAYLNGYKLEMVKLYPEGACEARFKFRGHGFVYFYCNKHGLFKHRV